MGVVEIIALLSVGAVPVVVIGGIFAWAAHAHKQRAAAWDGLAQKLGLTHANRQIYGLLDGVPVRLFTEVRGSGKNKQTYTVAAGLVLPGFDLGLAVYKHGFLSSVGAWMGMNDVTIGDGAFDAAFVIKGDEPHRVMALLQDPALKLALHQVLTAGWTFSVRDDAFRVETRGASSDLAWMEWSLRASAQIGGMLGAGRARIPCATPLAPHRDAWVQYAQAAGLAGMDTPLCMYGRQEGAAISVYAVRNAALQYGVEVTINFDRPLGLGLLVRPQGGLDAIGALLGGQDHALGDAEFDARFVVKATAKEALAAVLDVDVRKKMLDLVGRVGGVQLRDDGVTLRAPRFSDDPTGVPWLVAQARSLSDRVADNVARLGVTESGPYR
jgi:hypothetical protein